MAIKDKIWYRSRGWSGRKDKSKNKEIKRYKGRRIYKDKNKGRNGDKYRNIDTKINKTKGQAEKRGITYINKERLTKKNLKVFIKRGKHKRKKKENGLIAIFQINNLIQINET